MVTPLRADNPPTFLFEIDASAVPGGFNPYGVALDSSNNVYVADIGNSRIEKLTSSGNYLTQWDSYGTNNGQFISPQGIAVDRSNNVYVTDSFNFRVEKFDSQGNYLAQWGSYGTNNGQFEGPNGIALDSSNNVYVADPLNNRIEKFDSNGNYLKQWGRNGSGNGQFNIPIGIAVDSRNNVYVTDADNNRVEKFTSNGTYLTQWGSYGSGNGQFNAPICVAVDRSNNVYVDDNSNYRIEKFSSNGTYLTQWGSSGNGDGQFSAPEGIAVDSTGNYIYVADAARIQAFVYNANIVPPIITQQPTNQTVVPGINVTFSVRVVGTAPLTYQWTSNNVAVPGGTNATFTLTNASLSASGTYYSVLVTNSYGSVLSSNAVLAVLPALVTTQPASGLSATGAVLNGSVTVGPDETVVWFDWGTDTNYGTIAGATVVPGKNGSTNISAALSGLSGNFYHYRIAASNNFGIVYGDDQMFTVGFAPTATTLAPANSTNGSTLNAAVNPNGWDTTVYFQWATPTLTNSTPGMDIGAGATSLNVSSFVTGLAPFTPYQYQVVASNALGTVGGGTEFSVSLPGPQLTITPSGANVILAWPTNAIGWTLEWATNLVSPIAWNANLTVWTGQAVIGSQNAVTNPITGTQMFYRLARGQYFWVDWFGFRSAMKSAGAISYGHQLSIFSGPFTSHDMFYLPVPTRVIELANANPTLWSLDFSTTSGPSPGYGCFGQWEGFVGPQSIYSTVIVLIPGTPTSIDQCQGIGPYQGF